MFCFINVRSHCTDYKSLVTNFKLATMTYEDGRKKYIGCYENMNITVWEDGRYNIKGSIWKYMKGNNAGTFTMKDFQEAVAEIDSLTFGTFSNGDLIGFEYGINIPVLHSPLAYLNNISAISIKDRLMPLYPQYSKKTLWEMSTQGSVNKFRIYDKSSIAKTANAKIIRIEITIPNVKKKYKSCYLLKDLLQDSISIQLLKSLRNAINNLVPVDLSLNPKISTTSCKQNLKMVLLSCGLPLHKIIEKLEQVIPNKYTLRSEIASLKKMYLSLEWKSVYLPELISKANETIDNNILHVQKENND